MHSPNLSTQFPPRQQTRPYRIFIKRDGGLGVLAGEWPDVMPDAIWHELQDWSADLSSGVGPDPVYIAWRADDGCAELIILRREGSGRS